MRVACSRWAVVGVIGFSWALCMSVEAQQAKKVYRIGSLASVRGGSEDALRRGLRDLENIEGQTYIIESRSAEGKLDRLPGLVADLIGLNVDVIVVSGTQGAMAAKKATQRIPIVFAIADDPVESGLVSSLAHPGGNLTGVTDLAGDLGGKRIDLLKETVPQISRLAVLVWKPDGPGNSAERNQIELAARASGIEVQLLEIRGHNDLETGFAAIIKASANAFIGLTDTRFANNRSRIVELSVKHRLPSVYPNRNFVEAGGLMSYGTNRFQWRRRVAYYVDKILKGTKPADLPVEQPKKFELIINLKAAKQIGLTMPPNVLARADRVIR